MRPARMGGERAPASWNIRPESPCRAQTGWRSVGDQALARELRARLVEGDVGGREDHVGLHQLVVIERLAVGLHQLEHLAPQLPEAGFVALLHRAHRAVVELVEPLSVAVGQLELPLARY